MAWRVENKRDKAKSRALVVVDSEGHGREFRLYPVGSMVCQRF